MLLPRKLPLRLMLLLELRQLLIQAVQCEE
jgi:hypothetical protein